MVKEALAAWKRQQHEPRVPFDGHHSAGQEPAHEETENQRRLTRSTAPLSLAGAGPPAHYSCSRSPWVDHCPGGEPSPV